MCVGVCIMIIMIINVCVGMCVYIYIMIVVIGGRWN